MAIGMADCPGGGVGDLGVHVGAVWSGQRDPFPAVGALLLRVKEQTPDECSTACWRSYLGTWEIREGTFYLVKLEGKYRLEGDEPLLADWFSGVLRIPRGELLEYVHMGFGSVYEEELHIKICKGKVVASKVIDNRGKEHDADKLGWRNLPGGENRFDGDKW